MILLTGCSGYIGQCLESYFNKKELIITDKNKPKYKTEKKFYKINLLKKEKIKNIFKSQKINTVIHLAGKSLVDEKANYNDYFRNNVIATRNLVNVMETFKVKNIIFSSTASVYKKSMKIVNENSKVKPVSKYSRTKLMCEKLIKKKCENFIILRFFNVASSIPKIKRGENHNPETHLIPSFIQCVLKNKFLKINGKNYKTKDGTCVRDYIHIKDICSAIKNSLKVIKNKKKVINIGTNKGFSILEVIEKLSKVIKKKVKFTYRKKRKGDSPFLVSDFKKSKKILRWKPINSNLNKIIKDEILWQKINLN